MSEQLSVEQWNALPESTKKILAERGLAPKTDAPNLDTKPEGAAPSAGLPDLDDIPDQSGTGPQFLPWAEFDVEATLDQVQHRVGKRSGPHYYATLTVTKASEQSLQNGLAVGQTRALIWKYNLQTFGSDLDKAMRELNKYKQFVRQISGLPEGAKGVTEASGDLITDSQKTPSLGKRIRIISVRGGENKKNPGTYFHNLSFIPLD